MSYEILYRTLQYLASPTNPGSAQTPEGGCSTRSTVSPRYSSIRQQRHIELLQHPLRAHRLTDAEKNTPRISRASLVVIARASNIPWRGAVGATGCSRRPGKTATTESSVLDCLALHAIRHRSDRRVDDDEHHSPAMKPDLESTSDAPAITMRGSSGTSLAMSRSKRHTRCAHHGKASHGTRTQSVKKDTYRFDRYPGHGTKTWISRAGFARRDFFARTIFPYSTQICLVSPGLSMNRAAHDI